MLFLICLTAIYIHLKGIDQIKLNKEIDNVNLARVWDLLETRNILSKKRLVFRVNF